MSILFRKSFRARKNFQQRGSIKVKAQVIRAGVAFKSLHFSEKEDFSKIFLFERKLKWSKYSLQMNPLSHKGNLFGANMALV